MVPELCRGHDVPQGQGADDFGADGLANGNDILDGRSGGGCVVDNEYSFAGNIIVGDGIFGVWVDVAGGDARDIFGIIRQGCTSGNDADKS